MNRPFRMRWENRHKWLMWFWIINFPICAVMYLFLSEKVMGFYIAICSVYANAETSAAAKESKENNIPFYKKWYNKLVRDRR